VPTKYCLNDKKNLSRAVWWLEVFVNITQRYDR